MFQFLDISISASKIQLTTYLVCVCLFSISFLVFVNSSLSFIITERIGLEEGIGTAVGNLGFADELFALIACPLWGILSDRIGVQKVIVTGYIIIGSSLILLILAQNVFPQLLLARLCFSLGASAASTMVTATLPSMVAPVPGSDQANFSDSSSKLAGFVGMFTGLGALLALFVLLPLPTVFSNHGLPKDAAISHSLVVVSMLSFVVAIICIFGLRNLSADRNRNWRNLFRTVNPEEACDNHSPLTAAPAMRVATTSMSPPSPLSSTFKKFLLAFKLGLEDSDIVLAYLAGFVARASSIAISLFIPLFVNSYFIRSGKCDSIKDPSTIKQTCHKAYVTASILTGVSQLVALSSAPFFGYFTSYYGWTNLPLLLGAGAGFIGYISLGLTKSPTPQTTEGKLLLYSVVSLIGFSQISAIVSSLGILSQAIQKEVRSHLTDCDLPPTEILPLLDTSMSTQNKIQIKGSIAGVYSLCGGIGILVVTKLGGFLFDQIDNGSPFFILAGFNGILLVFGGFHVLANKSS